MNDFESIQQNKAKPSFKYPLFNAEMRIFCILFEKNKTVYRIFANQFSNAIALFFR